MTTASRAALATPTVDATTYAIDGFVIRTPLLPATQFIDLGDGLPDVGWEAPDEFARLTSSIRARVRSVVTASEVAEALFLASPALADSLPIWLEDPLSQRGQKIERSLVKYLARMSTRPTPFGLFSGCSTGRIGSRTTLTLELRSHVERHSRLDMDYLFALTEALNRLPALRAQLLFRPNDTLLALGGRYRYVEPRVSSGNIRQYHLVAIERTPYLDLLLEESARGAALATLVNRLVQYDAEITAEEASVYLNELIDSHVLVSTLQPPVTGREPARQIVEQLQRLGAADMSITLASAVDRLERLDTGGAGHKMAEYQAILEILKPLPAPVEISRLVQVDMRKPGNMVLGPAVRAEIERCANTLSRFGRVVDQLSNFRTAFEKRYGTAVVPLLQVLDEESGIGLGTSSASDGSPLIAGFGVGNASEVRDPSWKARDTWLLTRLQSLWTDRVTELVLTDEELQRLFGSAKGAPSPDAFSVMFTLSASSTEAIDRDDFLLEFRGMVGPSGARILGRFCHVDENVAAIVEQHMREEEQQDPDAVFAEIVHLPQGRIGNVILRPVLRKYELTYLGRSGAPDAEQITLSDLRITVRGDQVLLWSARLGKRVVPRMTNAHNYAQPGSLLPYRFLALLQTEGLRAAFGWDWGPLAGAPYLPRVRWGRCVLSRASWRATSDELQPLEKLTGGERFAATRAWARGRRMPRLVELVDGDNELLVDFDNPLSVDAFIELVDTRPSIQIKEVFPLPENFCVSSPEGMFTHEICVPVIRNRPPAMVKASIEMPAIVGSSRRRDSLPGSDWMFLKIYGGAGEIDQILTTVVAPTVADARARQLSDRWFFIRYADPDYHIRLRFRGDPGLLHGEVLVAIHEGMRSAWDSGSISGVRLDTYQPEVERYGGDVGIDLAEEIFQVDSEAVLSLLCQLDGDQGLDARWQLALCGVETMLEDFGFDTNEKREIVARRRREYGREFDVDSGPGRHALGERFRRYRRTIDGLLNRDSDVARQLEWGLAIWQQRSAKMRPLIERLRAAERDGRLTVPVATLVDSYLHMFVNRLVRAQGRIHELVMFDFLDRHFESVDARARRGRDPRPHKKGTRAMAVSG